MKFSKQQMQDLAYEDFDPEKFEIISRELYGTTRWSNLYEMVFKHDGKFYQSSYSVGATECQDESPYEYAGDSEGMIEVVEVFPVEVTVTQYKTKKQLEAA